MDSLVRHSLASTLLHGERVTLLSEMRSGRKLASMRKGEQKIRIERPLDGDECMCLTPLQAEQLSAELRRLVDLAG